MLKTTDTIYALSSGSLPAGVAVLRISGPAALSAAKALIEGNLPQPRKASLKTIRNRNGLVIDQGLMLVFPQPHSFTGEDCVEIQVHGSRAVMAALYEVLSQESSLRPAEAGEFSKRAYENGKMDLVEVEGLADLLQAETEMQRRLAIEHSSGTLSVLYDGWADRLTRARALIEAELDFADEDDVPGSVSDQVWRQMALLSEEIREHLLGAQAAEIIRDGYRIALVGAPNVGKSTLMNRLSGREVAIVTAIAGTTRDVISVDMNINGYLVHLSDTAGIRATDDIVEQEGVRRARETAHKANLVLFLSDIDSYPEQLNRNLSQVETLRLRTKADLHNGQSSGAYDFYISAQTGEGIDLLQDHIQKRIESQLGSASMLAPARSRHKKRLEETLSYVTDALNLEDADLAIRAEYLRLAASSLGRITGRVDVEDLLGVIFSEFCIGK